MKTIVYIDGLNLYHGCLQKSPYKWLDLAALFAKILGPKYQITQINYFTSLVGNVSYKIKNPERQENYIHALENYKPQGSPKINVEYGKFHENITRLPKAKSPDRTVEIIKIEEKYTDVNLAVRMLDDAWRNKFQCGVLVSSDSDMAGAMKLVRKVPTVKRVGLITPEETYSFRAKERHTPSKLKRQADFQKTIRESDLRACQLPNPIPGTNIQKPKEW